VVLDTPRFSCFLVPDVFHRSRHVSDGLCARKVIRVRVSSGNSRRLYAAEAGPTVMPLYKHDPQAEKRETSVQEFCGMRSGQVVLYGALTQPPSGVTS
jgi:hypothetical protein